MNKTEKELEEECCRIARRRGIAALKLEKNGNAGCPDRLFVARGGRTLYVEFKTVRGVVSPEQQHWKEFLGYSSYVIRSAEEFTLLVDTYF